MRLARLRWIVRAGVLGCLFPVFVTAFSLANEPDPMLPDLPAPNQTRLTPPAGGASSTLADPLADPSALPPEVPKDLLRFRERLADWNSGKGGWSKRAGKILFTDRFAMVT